MSLVGTRPPTVDEWDKYELHHRARLATKPGLTGMWQVSGRSNITDFEEVVKLDKQYISECSLLTYISPIKLFFIWPTESIGFIYGLILYHHKKSIINQLENNRFIKIIALFLLSAILGVLFRRNNLYLLYGISAT